MKTAALLAAVVLVVVACSEAQKPAKTSPKRPPIEAGQQEPAAGSAKPGKKAAWQDAADQETGSTIVTSKAALWSKADVVADESLVGEWQVEAPPVRLFKGE